MLPIEHHHRPHNKFRYDRKQFSIRQNAEASHPGSHIETGGSQMEFALQEVTRTFNFDVNGLGPAKSNVVKILDSIEKDTIAVYNPDDEDAFQPVWNDKGELLLHERATLEVNIADWLCAACQRMRLDNESDVNREGRTDRTLAWYENDSRKTLFNVNSMLQPPGPAAFTGEVVLTTGATDLIEAEDGTGSDKFCWVVAHELVHVIEAMRVIVPAFMDWETYWSVALQNGVAGDSAVEIATHESLFLDEYGSENELAMVKQYWPSHADVWFSACYGTD
jgi:hypothetical protein